MKILAKWKEAVERVSIDVEGGRVVKQSSKDAAGGAATGDAGRLCQVEIAIDSERVGAGAYATLVMVRWEDAGGSKAVSFFLRDVTKERPIWVEQYGLIVTSADDARQYPEIAAVIAALGLEAKHERFQREPEETMEAAYARDRNLKCPTWLGLSRDMRTFRVGPQEQDQYGYFGEIKAFYHRTPQTIPGMDKPLNVGFCVGPGASCRVQLTRWLEEKTLPILRGRQVEEDVTYDVTMFVTLETQTLSTKAVRGSDWQAVYPNTAGHMLTAEQVRELKDLLEAEMHGREEETVCCVRVEAVNHGRAARYAWFKGANYWDPKVPTYDGSRGFSVIGGNDKVFGVHRLNGKPMPQREVAVLLAPGEKMVVEMLVPHQPVSVERAEKLSGMDFDAHLAACRAYWKEKLAGAARISVPEKEIDDRIKAGLLHCDLVAYGLEPEGNVLACIGWYSPIGSESAPIIQFFDSMGWHALAERSLQFFLDRQREDGFIQTFGRYELETGPFLWTMGEHWRYTRDEAWVRKVAPKVLKACDYLLQWRERNKLESLAGKGYGLAEGKVADPDDRFHSFMLNALAYVGIARAAEMLAAAHEAEAKRLGEEAKAYRADIRKAYDEALARSPVVPLGNGRWVPAPPPWTEYRGPVSLYAQGGDWQTHGMFGARDSLIGPLYLMIGEVLHAKEIGAEFLLRAHQELFTVENAGMSQPYYCRHDWAHLKRGEAKEFLKTYYNQLAGLQDRETYTFWEHYFYVGQHKTHEEGWFLMQTRWMLWLEEGRELALLRGVPRKWLEAGNQVVIEKAATYFGQMNLRVKSEGSRIVAEVECGGERKPATVTVRLPHSEGRKAVRVEGGQYDAATETVRVAEFPGQARIEAWF